jgi:excisionase family DNA binding protein
MSISEFELRGRSDNDNTATREPLWTVKDVADYLRLKRETVRVMARSGKLPAIKVGKLWRFMPDDMKSFMAGQATLKEPQER